ncbi:MAG: Rod shape-determining protein RodA [Candidatus Uhrbacteria bacterium GW2011_GWE2_40_58]|nr:MAG: Rod shape-determining protein RodA [Candidatus Uhrbacteria bacterium GW2011_GWF2_40_263]KKR68025.1 MAG: Rod shape-determining protein RodA [Candidatus Uhrbacteria bacterium GW2011_GWE2_40_58]OGL92940.1 MAG: rod shape-determining protein RodA [Candidatus Uhrbacteria bacterium RIFOXYA2_FULL_40_9]HCB55781.1 rod shape-determining protein RodA [Candidatus Uhrbacteria bacterium]
MLEKYTNYFRSNDWWLLTTMLVLVMFGLAAIYSVELSQETAGFLNIKKQLIALVIGLGCYSFFAYYNYRLLQNYSVLLYVIGLLLLIGVLLFGSTIRGTTGWYNLGPFGFQPVEFMKLALAIALATYCSQRARRLFGVREILETMAITGVPVFFTLLQPDFGSAMLLIGIWFVVVLFAGIQRKHFLFLTLCAILFGIFAWFFLLADYQQARIATFFDPSLDPLGEGYNVTQAVIAVGAGGSYGSGLGFGSQSQLKFLPESQTDFIFAVIAEELGFVGVSIVFITFSLLFWRILTTAKRARDDFALYFVLAMGGSIFLQFVVNVGMNLGMLPVTGLGLPMVSYGGSSLILFLSMLGVIQSSVIRSKHLSQSSFCS